MVSNERNRSILVVAAVLGMFLGACGEVSQDVGETIALHVDEIKYYESYHRLAEDSDVVVMGIVESMELGRLVNDSGHEEESSTQYLDVVVRVEDVVKGRVAKGTVVVEWSGWWVDGSTGEAGPRLSANGLVPQVGDSMIWFLVADQRDRDHLPDYEWDRYEWVSLDGVLRVDDGLVFTDIDGEGRLAHLVNGRSIDEFRSLLATNP